MAEWGVVGVIISLVGLFLTVGMPVIRLITSITKLTGGLEALQKDMEKLNLSSVAEHKELWDHNEEQDGKISDHETRITLIERKE